MRARPLPVAVLRQTSAPASAGAAPAPDRERSRDQERTRAPVTEVTSAPPTTAFASEGVARPMKTGAPSRVVAVTVVGRSTRLSTDGSRTTTLPRGGVVVNV